MTDLGAISQAFDALKHATEILKALRGAETLYEKAELKLKIAELAEAVATARLGLLEAQTEIQNLKDQISRGSAEIRAKVVTREGVYFVVDGDRETGPFCPRCYEAEGRRMPLTRFSGPFAVIGTFNCPQCKATY